MPFEIRGFSLPLVVFSIGVVLTGSSFAGFFLNDGGGDGAISSLGFVYGTFKNQNICIFTTREYQNACIFHDLSKGVEQMNHVFQE